MIVAKVGGSLYDDPRLGVALRAWCAEQTEPVTLVPGGGPFADAVRTLDTAQRLGEEASHWLAIAAMDVGGRFLRALLDHPLPLRERVDTSGASDGVRGSAPTYHPSPRRMPRTRRPSPTRGEGEDGLPAVRILPCVAFFRLHDRTPHTWAATSDSLAAVAAQVFGASKLVLLKSTDVPPGTPWAEAAARGWVDAYFPTAVQGAAFAVEVVNFRRNADARLAH